MTKEVKKLYVEKIVENGNTGVTQNRDKIKHNCDLILPGLSKILTDYNG